MAECKAAREKCDLLKMVVIRLGEKVYNGEEGDEGYRLLRFLNAIMYPHKEDFMDTISEYIDFSDNEELWKEAGHMTGLGQSIYEEGVEDGIEKGIEELIVKKHIQGVSGEDIADFLEMSVEKVNGIISKHLFCNTP